MHLTLLEHHAAWIVFLGILAEQIGLPVPGLPILVTAGAYVALGKLGLAHTVTLSVTASLIGDFFWFFLGRSRGSRVLGWMCKISIEPDTCVRKTEHLFLRFGARSLMIAKFVPGLNTVLPPLAGIFGVPLPRFFIFDSLGALLYAGVYISIGYVFSNELEKILLFLEHYGARFSGLVFFSLAIYIAYKLAQRQRVLKMLRMEKISIDDYRRDVAAGTLYTVLDTRSETELAADPFVLPGAKNIPYEAIERRYAELPSNREIIAYCSCPNEVTSARAALKLQHRGFDVRPLLGGIEAWRELGYPLKPHPTETPAMAN